MRVKALKRVQRLYQLNIKVRYQGKQPYYFHKKTKKIMKCLPSFMQSRADWLDPDALAISDDENDAAEVILKKEDRMALRNYPRSRMQLAVDRCEDEDNKHLVSTLDLHQLKAARISARVYDLTFLRVLILSDNNLTYISNSITALTK